MQSNPEQIKKIALIVYFFINSKSVEFSLAKKQIEKILGYRMNHDYFKKYYNEALSVLQESNVSFSDENITPSKVKQIEIKDSKKAVQQECKNECIDDNFYNDSFYTEETLFVEDYSIKNENNATQAIHNDIDELFSTPVAEFQPKPPIEKTDEFEEASVSVDYTNDKEEVPEIFETIHSEKNEVVSDTNSQEIAISPKTFIDKTKIKKKAKHKEVIEVEIVDTIKEDGYKYYDFMDTKVWIDFEKFDGWLKKKYNTDSIEDIDYKLRWYENLLLLNVYYNELIEKNNTELISLLRENSVKESIYGAPCIRNIKKEHGGNFAEFSKEYPDFKESKDIKNEDNFWIITEWKKGTATRKYLDTFIGKIKREILEEYEGISEKEIEDTIDVALSNWERDVSKIRTRSDNFKFVDVIEFTGCDIDLVYHIDYIQSFLPEKALLNYVPPMSLEDDYSELLSIPHGESLKERIKNLMYVLFRSVVKEEEPKTRLWQLSRKIYKDEKLRKYWREEIFLLKDGEFGSSDIEENDKIFEEVLDEVVSLNAQLMRAYYKWTKYSDFINKQEKWVFEYNKVILESKKEIILKEFEKNGISLQK